MPRKPRRIVSFVGKADLEAAGVKPSRRPETVEIGPIWRFLQHQLENSEIGTYDGDCILLLDDRADTGERELYVRWLTIKLASLYTRWAIPVDRVVLQLDGKPTSLRLLDREVTRVIPRDRHETRFMVSAGTGAMYATLVLAAQTLQLRRPRLFEASPDADVVELDVPWDIGLRRHQRSRRAPGARRQAARPGSLLPYTVIDDDAVCAVYAALRRLASRPPAVYGSSNVLLLHGPAGAGKRHAARQFAQWVNRGEHTVDATTGPDLAALRNHGTLIVPNLQDAVARWDAWRQAARDLPEHRFVFLWRSDGMADIGPVQALHDGLAGAGCFRLPPLAERSDQIALVEAFAGRAGKLDGKVRQRFQYPLSSRELTSNLHELETLVNMAAAADDDPHISAIGVERAQLQLDAVRAQSLLPRLARVIAEQGYVGRVDLPSLFDAMEALAMDIQGGGGSTNNDIAKRIGIARTTLFNKDRMTDRREALRKVLEAWPEWLDD